MIIDNSIIVVLSNKAHIYIHPAGTGSLPGLLAVTAAVLAGSVCRGLLSVVLVACRPPGGLLWALWAVLVLSWCLSCLPSRCPAWAGRDLLALPGGIAACRPLPCGVFLSAPHLQVHSTAEGCLVPFSGPYRARGLVLLPLARTKSDFYFKKSAKKQKNLLT